MNVITLTGNAVQDAELAYTPSGTAITKGSIAVRRDFKNKQTNEYDSDFINWKAIGGLGEVMANHIKKGDKFGLFGSMQVNVYEKDGQKKYFYEVIVKGFDFPNKPKGGGQQQSNQQQEQNRGFNNKGPVNDDPFANGTPIDISDDDLPF